jgi:amino acid adenylation domain-containing protein
MGSENIEDIYTCSPLQQGMLFHVLSDPDSEMYVERAICDLQGALDLTSFQRAWQGLVDRHPALRTAFRWEGVRKPVQVVRRLAPLHLCYYDWRALSVTQQETQQESVINADRSSFSNLADPPLMRLYVMRATENSYRLIWSIHHLIHDAWSLSILFKEFLASYEALISGHTVPLEPPPPRYRDYIAWLKKQDTVAAGRFWRQALQGFTTPTPLPADTGVNGRSDGPRCVDRQEVHLSVDATAAMDSFLRKNHLTLYTVMQGAWALLLSYFAGELDVVFGTVVSGRPPELGMVSTVGLFINTLPVRAQIRMGDPLLPWLKELQKSQAKMQPHQYSPLPQVKLWSSVARSLPLFESILVVENSLEGLECISGAEIGGLQFREVRTVVNSNYPLAIKVTPGPRLWIEAAYDPRRLNASGIARMLKLLEVLLVAMTTRPASKLIDLAGRLEEVDLEVIGKAEREQLLAEWNRTQSDYPREQSIYELFERQVELTPDRTAVAFGDEQLSYAELNGRANQLAHYLRGLGVRPDTRVGVLMERSVEMVVGVLGVLKAGGAYAPLDPAYPEERLAFMIEDAKVQVMLAQERLLGALPKYQCQAVCLDSGWDEMAEQSAENPVNVARPDNLAYVIYTSGSTGRPKGVAVTHRNVVRLVKGADYARFDPDEVFLQLAPITFDASTFELWGCLLNGARLVIFPPLKPSLAELGQALRRHGVTTLWLTAGLFHQMVDDRLEDLAGVRQLLAGGDVLSPRHVERAAEELKGCQLINGYGPTESTTFACCHPVTPSDGKIGQSVSIGRPIANTSVYVLNGRSRPAPVGAAGELHIGGDGLARGYLDRPDLTAERFIPHPYSKEPGARLYRTGDLARYLPDGNLEFLGRLDDQVKLRGYRIELGEIEAALREHPGIREAVALARQDSAGEKRLVAYVVCEPEAPATVAELRSHLRRRLPDYMTPSAFGTLDELPLTPNGKVDRRALPAPDQARLDVEAAHVAPRTPAEEVIAGIWSQVLGVERVGVYDNFFELGGHSLLATQVISRVRGAFQIEAPLRSLFEGPTVAELAQGVESGVRWEMAPTTASIVRVSREGVIPLSFAQRRLWFLDQLMPDNSLYNISAAVRLQGRLDVKAFERSLNEVVNRHEVLRTAFPSVNGQPAQSIAPALPLTIPLIDLREFPQEAQEARAQLLAAEEAQRPFNLAEGPLLCATLLRLGDEDHVALLTMHHIVSDGWSMGVLVGEVAALYEAYSQGRPSPLEELPVQYADYAAWQREWLSGEVLEAQLEYWKRQLAGLSVLNLPIDRPRPSVQTYRGAMESLRLPAALTDSLRELSRREDVTLFMTLLAAFQTLLMRYTGQRDVVVGSPIANRNRAEIEGLIGFFVNTLALRTDLGGAPTFVELLGRVREVALGAYAHQDLPFERLVEEVQPERDLGRHPLFQVMMVLQNAPREVMELPGLNLSLLPNERAVVKFDLTLSVIEEKAGLVVTMWYSSDLFEAETTKRMLGHYQKLLESIVANPQQRLIDLQMLTDSERHQLLFERNDTAKAYPKDACLHELFERQAERTPENVAVVCESDRLTYAELNRRANQLARHLQRSGVGPESTVALLMERSVEMIISIIGVLKAGGAYVPLDPQHPQERLAFMLKDAQVKVLLTQERLSDALPNGHSAQVVRLDSDWELIAQGSGNLQNAVTADNLAYVLYTSGSTGLPKGTMIEHRSVVNYLCWVNRELLSEAGRNVPASTSLTFDASLKQLLAPLLRGDEVWLLSSAIVAEPAELLKEINTRDNVVFNCVPSLWAAILDAIRSQQAVAPGANLRSILIGGEQLSAELVRRSFAQAPHLKIWNLYGPTEATANASVARVVPEKEISIGRAIANAQLYVLDSHMNPTPVRAAGELHIGGDGLARGYLDRPDLTAERFIPHPYSKEPGARLYRTGDLARYLPDGNLEFLGRLDDQVKLRGYRIELGEIEAALREHPGIREAVALARQDSPGEKRLVAYIVPEREPAPTVSEARAFLKERLPDYMVPSAFVTLDGLPLSPNGKVDRRALPAPDQTRPEVGAVHIAPRTPAEEVIAGIWSQVLGVERVGVYDNFFDLGGHSLLATQVISRVRGAFQVEAPLRSLFEGPTVAELAQGIEAELRAVARMQMPAISRVSREGVIPLSFAQRRLWFLDQLMPGNSFYNIPAAVRLQGRLDMKAFERSLNEVVNRHESLRTRFVSEEGQASQVIAAAGSPALPLLDLRGLSEQEREAEARRLAREEAQRQFDLVEGPLLRATLLRLGDEDYVALLTMHHIVSDGWSMGVLVREVAALYEAYSQGRPSPLEELPVQYADYAAWQREWLSGEVLEAQLEYWKQRLAGAPPALELPTDHPRPSVQTYRGATESLRLPAALADSLRELSRREDVTLFMTLLAAFQTLLMRYTGQRDVVVGSPIANRNRAEIEGLIGFFVNTLALRTDLSGDPPFVELLGRVREVALGAYGRQDLPFERLVEELQPERDLSRHPLFQVMMVLQNAPREGAELPGLRLSTLPSESGTTKFDLTLSLVEGEGGLAGSLEYSTDLFEAETVRRMLGHYRKLSESVVADPQRRLSELELLTEEERELLLIEWNQTQRDYPREQSIHELFERQVELTPDRTAVAFGDEQLSYAELNRRGNQLANYLRRHGVRPDTRVGVLMERSVEMVVGVLGALKAGGAYVPLDPATPNERLAFILEDAQVTTLLTQESLMAALPAHNAKVARVDVEREAILRQSEESPASGVTVENAAYVIYTSGSTGLPKGVSVTHANVGRLFDASRAWFHFDERDAWTLFHSYAFDFSVWEMWGALLHGGRLVIVPYFVSRSPEAFYELLRDERVTVLNQTPSAFRQLMQYERSAGDAQELSLRLVIFGGEALDLKSLRPWFERHGDESPQLVNMYGITETTVHVTYRPITKADAAVATGSLIGGPIPDLQVYALEWRLQPAPLGIAGEMYVGGAGLARGYLNRPDLTAERFIPHPFSKEPGARLYRTGDLARYLPDGNLEFLGRLDDQVKLRGYRIELGEIEAALREHPRLREAVALARQDSSGEKRLVVYLVSDREPGPTVSEARAFLKERLPDYMVPSAFVSLDKLPLTPNGKVDRRALPAPDQARPDVEAAYVAPRTPAEEVIAGIWSQVLGVERVGVYDNFFELGGHSLLATQVVARVFDAFQVRIPLASLFKSPTVEVMVEEITRAWGGREIVEEIARTVKEVERLSADEIKEMLVSF